MGTRGGRSRVRALAQIAAAIVMVAYPAAGLDKLLPEPKCDDRVAVGGEKCCTQIKAYTKDLKLSSEEASQIAEVPGNLELACPGNATYRACNATTWAKVEGYPDFETRCTSNGGNVAFADLDTNSITANARQTVIKGRFICQPTLCPFVAAAGYAKWAEGDVCTSILNERSAQYAACGASYSLETYTPPTGRDINYLAPSALKVQVLPINEVNITLEGLGVKNVCANALARLDTRKYWREAILKLMAKAQDAGCFGGDCLKPGTGSCECNWQKTRELSILYRAAQDACNTASQTTDARGRIQGSGVLCPFDQQVVSAAYQLFKDWLTPKNTFTFSASSALCTPNECDQADMNLYLSWLSTKNAHQTDMCLVREGVASTTVGSCHPVPFSPQRQCPPYVHRGSKLSPLGISLLVLGLLGGGIAALWARRSYRRLIRRRRKRRPDGPAPAAAAVGDAPVTGYALMGDEGAAGAVVGGSSAAAGNYDAAYSDDSDDDYEDGTAPHLMSVHVKLSDPLGKAKKSWKQRAAEKARARKAKETRMGGGRRSDRIAAEAAQFGVIAEGGEEGTSTEMSQPPSSTSSKSGKPRWLRGSKKEKALFDPESGEPLNEAARIVRATQTVEPEFDEHTGAPLNHAARVIISGPAAGTSPTQMAPIAEEPEFDQVTGAAMNEAAQRLVGGRSDEPEFDELTGAPMNDAARRVMAQNS